MKMPNCPGRGAGQGFKEVTDNSTEILPQNIDSDCLNLHPEACSITGVKIWLH
jgi:hypothetical protein